MMKKATVLFLVSAISILSAFAQHKADTMYVDNFEKSNNQSFLGGSWTSVSDQVIGGATQAKLDYVSDSSSKSQVLRLMYSLQKPSYPFATLSSSLTGEQIPEGEFDRIVYQFKGAKHSFVYRTFSALDRAFFQKEIKASKKWRTVVIRLSDLAQPSWGLPMKFNLRDVESLDWQIWGDDGDTGSVYIDNVRFIRANDQAGRKEKKNAFGNKKGDSCAHFILSSSPDKLLKNCKEYIQKNTSYRNAHLLITTYEKRADSLSDIINNTSLNRKKKTAFQELIRLAVNDTLSDVYFKAKGMNPSWLLQLEKYIPLAFLYQLDKDYRKQSILKEHALSWALNIYRFSAENDIDYFKTSIPDSSFESEIKLYGIRANEVIAELGAGSGYFEQAISKYCDDLLVYVNEGDSALVAKLETRLQFLDIHDQKNIQYIPVLGSEKSSGLPEGKMDRIIIKNTFHHFTYPNEMLQDLKKVLKKDGRLFITDILLGDIKNPQCHLHLPRDLFLKYLSDNGFVLMKETKLSYDQFTCFEFQVASPK